MLCRGHQFPPSQPDLGMYQHAIDERISIRDISWPGIGAQKASQHLEQCRSCQALGLMTLVLHLNEAAICICTAQIIARACQWQAVEPRTQLVKRLDLQWVLLGYAIQCCIQAGIVYKNPLRVTG